jgi:hypothetical protein
MRYIRKRMPPLSLAYPRFVIRDREFESRFLQRRVLREPVPVALTSTGTLACEDRPQPGPFLGSWQEHLRGVIE